MKKLTIIIAMIMLFVLNNAKVESIIIPNEAIRVRIIANSNSKEDLKIKEQLKEDIEPTIYRLLKNVTDINKARTILKNNIDNIDIEVKRSLINQNNNTKYNVNYGLNYFPEKNFKGIIYKEGYYESLVITIGKGEGNNWWCVLYPPLCMIEVESIENSNIEYKSYINEILNKYLNK